MATSHCVNVGSHIGQYRILRKLGAGGMGTVFLGEHILLKRRAAIKTLLPSLTAHQDIVERFFNEARATSAIGDAGVVQIFDFGYHVDGTAYIVMELLEGESLMDRLERLGRLPVGEALRIVRQVACALAAAHDRGIVHRDLKPDNLFLVRDAEAQGGERTKVLDFGICKVEEGSDSSITQSGTMMGTPIYMSPEQCQGAGRVDHRADIYALGCVLFQILTGRIPFEGEGPGEIIAAHLKDEPPKPSSLVDVPPMVDALVAKCLAKNPDDRFATMTDLAHEIESIQKRMSTPAPIAPDAPQAMWLHRGFRSVYDGNFGTGVPTKGPDIAVMPQTVAGRRRKPTTLNTASGEAAAWPRKHGMRAAFAIFLVGLATALVATTFVLDNRARESEAAVLPEPARVEQKPAVAAEPPTPDPEIAPDAGVPEAKAPVVEAEVGTDKVVVEKPQQQSRPAVGKPRKTARPQVRRPVAPKQAPPEDLYDTR